MTSNGSNESNQNKDTQNIYNQTAKQPEEPKQFHKKPKALMNLITPSISFADSCKKITHEDSISRRLRSVTKKIE